VISIGTTRRNYVATHAIDGARHPGVRFRRVPHLPLHALTRDPFWGGATAVLAPGSVDLVHLYNEVGWSSRPFVVSFEDELPRGRRRRRSFAAGLRSLGSNRCRAVLAMSAHAARRLGADPVTGPVLGPKCVVVPPCVPRRDDAYARHLRFLDERRDGDALELLFVGVEFFRKGGEFVLDALEPLAARGAPPIRLTVVSSFAPDGYATPFDAERVRAVRARIAGLPWVHVVERLEPDAVRDRMAIADALLLPTLDETFGFVAVEALATGLPVIASRLRALPEILPADLLARAIPYAADDGIWPGLRLWRREGRGAFDRVYAAARDVAVETLRARVASLSSDAAARRSEAAAYRAHYLARHTPEALGRRLFDVYRRVIVRR
jgi:glycosyltransferase involved in cell wall biosynthesis